MSTLEAKNYCAYSDVFGMPVKRFKCEKPKESTKCKYYESDETPTTQMNECMHESFGVCARSAARKEALAEVELMERLENI